MHQFSILLAMSLLVATAVGQDANVRVATYNVALHRNQSGELTRELASGTCGQARRLAAVIRTVRPDILLINEIDYSPDHAAVTSFVEQYLAVPQGPLEAIDFPFVYSAPVNTGVPSGMDLDRDGATDGPGDAYGFGKYPGQYGMAVLSRYPIATDQVRTFQKLKWADVPEARVPVDPASGTPYYAPHVWRQLRLSSKSHWDVPIEVPALGRLHFLVSHPTPPVFDGPEDRNGCRNYDEIRLWADYVAENPPEYLCDDAGQRGGLAAGEFFVVAGDLNCDPADGDTQPAGIALLLGHPRINGAAPPTSDGAVAATNAQVELNRGQQGDPATDTADFSGDGVRNMRVDYVLPSRDLTAVATGVFWPTGGNPGADLVTASDHRLVWVDLQTSP